MANSTMGTGTSNTKASGSTATTPAAKSSANKDSTSTTTPAASAATAVATPSAVTPASVNPTSLKKLPTSANKSTAAAQPNSFQAYLEKLDSEKQISYLMLGASEALPNFSVKRTHPYSFFFFKKKGYKQIFQPNKNIIVQEIKRRQPDAKPNQNNRSNDELMEMLRDRWPLVESDKEYVLEKEKDYRKVLLGALNPKDVIQLDDLGDLASPTATSTSGPPRKRAIGETTSSSPSRSGMSTLGSVAASTSYYATSNKRRSTGGISSVASTTAVESMLAECAAKLSFANLASTVEALKKERFDLQWKRLPLTKAPNPANVQSMSMIDNRITEIDESIAQYEAKMGLPKKSRSVGV